MCVFPGIWHPCQNKIETKEKQRNKQQFLLVAEKNLYNSNWLSEGFLSPSQFCMITNLKGITWKNSLFFNALWNTRSNGQTHCCEAQGTVPTKLNKTLQSKAFTQSSVSKEVVLLCNLKFRPANVWNFWPKSPDQSPGIWRPLSLLRTYLQCARSSGSVRGCHHQWLVLLKAVRTSPPTNPCRASSHSNHVYVLRNVTAHTSLTPSDDVVWLVTIETTPAGKKGMIDTSFLDNFRLKKFANE